MRIALSLVAAALLRTAHRAGWPALVGGMLIVASLALVLTATNPAREQITSVNAQRKQLREMANKTLRSKGAEPISAQAQLRNFYASFPARSSLPDALMLVHRVASRNDLRDTRADYRDTPEPGTPLVRVRIEIPVSGSYASIRTWIAELLKALPSLTLDGLELRRPNIGQPQLEARVRFQLLLRSTP